MKSAIPTIYSTLKPGVDKATQIANDCFRRSKIKATWPQKKVLRTFEKLALNAAISYKMTQSTSRVSQNWRHLSNFRRRMQQQGSFPTIMQQLSLELFDAAKKHKSNDQPIGAQQSSPQSPQTSLRTPIFVHPPLPKRNRQIAFGNRDSELWHLRFSSPASHVSCKKKGATKRRCVQCNASTRFSCARCQMPLCSVNSKKKRCFRKWHAESEQVIV